MPQSLAKIYIHATFSTKNREPTIHDDWREELFNVLGGTANDSEYIRWQPEHHRKQSFQDELREWLRRYGIEWDERYVWD